jgi:hypothetical protein
LRSAPIHKKFPPFSGKLSQQREERIAKKLFRTMITSDRDLSVLFPEEPPAAAVEVADSAASFHEADLAALVRAAVLAFAVPGVAAAELQGVVVSVVQEVKLFFPVEEPVASAPEVQVVSAFRVAMVFFAVVQLAVLMESLSFPVAELTFVQQELSAVLVLLMDLFSLLACGLCFSDFFQEPNGLHYQTVKRSSYFPLLLLYFPAK